MQGFVLGFDGYATVPPPVGGFWRVSDWHEPLAPPPAPAPLGNPPQDDDGHRYDDPAGSFRTLYCATEPEGALGECLGDFAYSAAAARRIDAFLVEEPDEEFDVDYLKPLDEEDIASFNWTLARAPAIAGVRLIDVDDHRTYLASSITALPALARYGIRRLDRHTLLDERRYVTRTMAGVYRRDATDSTGRLRAAGLRFTSRLPPAWECWALWEPLPLEPGEADTERVTIETHALHRAADLLGVAIVRPERA